MSIINKTIDTLKLAWGNMEGSTFKEKIRSPHNWAVLTNRLFIVGAPVFVITAVALVALGALNLIFPIGFLASIPFQCAAAVLICGALAPAGAASLIHLALAHFQKKDSSLEYMHYDVL